MVRDADSPEETPPQPSPKGRGPGGGLPGVQSLTT